MTDTELAPKTSTMPATIDQPESLLAVITRAASDPSAMFAVPRRQELALIDMAYFWDRSIPEPNTGCWLWLAGLNNKGYAIMWRGKSSLATRVLAEIFFDRVAVEHMHVLHRCDQPSCVNPAHLRLGFHIDNMREMGARGRTNNAGMGNPRRVLDEDAVRRIRRSSGTLKQIAKDEGVSPSTINGIRQGHTWRNVI